MAKAKIYLYKEGNECTSLTGGWSKTLNATKTIQGGILNIQTTSTTSRASVSCVELIDFTNFDKAVFIAEGTGTLSINSSSFVIKSDNNFSTGNFIVSSTPAESVTNFKKQNIEINLSSINNGYIGYLKGGHTSAFSTNVKIYEVYLTTKENILTINSQENDNITFSANDLGLVAINKIDILVNGVVSKTYTDNYSNLSYTVDKSLCYIGNNNIEIRVTYSQGDDITGTVSEYLTYKHAIPQLPLETPLIDTVERVKLLTKSKQNEKDMLSSILTSKNVEVSEQDKMSDLIDKVDLLRDAPPPPLYLYKEGDECTDITGGIVQVSASGNMANSTFTKLEKSFTFQVAGTISADMTNNGFVTNNVINCTKYSKLIFKYKINNFQNPTYEFDIEHRANENKLYRGTSHSKVIHNKPHTVSGAEKEVFVDISNVNSAYMGIWFRIGGYGNLIIEVSEIRLEV